MKVILSNMCTALVGMLKPELGYYLRKRGKTFFSQRSAHSAPPDGHLRFIFLCAELAQNHLYISDIQVSREEIVKAFKEAGYMKPHYELVKYADDYPETFSATDVLNLKSELGL